MLALHGLTHRRTVWVFWGKVQCGLPTENPHGAKAPACHNNPTRGPSMGYPTWGQCGISGLSLPTLPDSKPSGQVCWVWSHNSQQAMKKVTQGQAEFTFSFLQVWPWVCGLGISLVLAPSTWHVYYFISSYFFITKSQNCWWFWRKKNLKKMSHEPWMDSCDP